MSTASLKAHKKVAEVTLNDAGKAATLTLKEPWLFDGSRGPFTLTNVEHGHKITKGAYHEAKGPKAPASPPVPGPSPTIRSPFGQSATPVAEEPPLGPIELPPMDMPSSPFIPYRAVAISDTREVFFWFWETGNKAMTTLESHARAIFSRHVRQESWGPDDYHIFIRRWTPADEAKRPSPFHALLKEHGHER